MMKCKYCGTKNEENQKYCKNCGMPLNYGKLLNCYYCGNSVNPKYNFCPECGAELKLKRKCPNCRVLVNYDDKYCKNCGKKLKDVEFKQDDDLEKDDKKSESEKQEDELSTFVDECIEKGLESYADSDYEEAISWFNKGVGTIINNSLDKNEDKRLVDLYIYRGDSYKEIDEIDRAKDNYKRGLIYAQSILAVDKVEKIKEKITKL